MNGSTLGDWLKRIERSAAWLAGKLDVATSTVTRWINGDVEIPAERVDEIASILERWTPDN